MKNTKWILLALICLIQFSCEKTSWAPSSENKVNRQVELLPLPKRVSLDQLPITLTEGIPTYPNTNAFLQALQAVSETHHDNFLNWSREIGLNSAFTVYTGILDRYETTPHPEDFRLTKAEKRLVGYPPDAAPVLHHGIAFAKLMNNYGRMIIGEDLHIFTEYEHIILDDGKHTPHKSFAERSLNTPEEGIHVFPLKQVINTEVISGVPPTKTRSLLEDCIYFAGDAEGGAELHYDRSKMDEQRVGCNRRRCRQRLDSRISVWTVITELLGTEYRVIGRAEQSYSNTRRSGWNWIRTFPDNRFDAPPGATPLTFRLISDLRIDGKRFVTLDESFQANYPSTQEETAAHDGSASGSWSLLDVNLAVPYPANTVTNTNSGIYLMEGRTRCRWSNRGNDPVNDPISVVFGCN